MTWDAVAYSKFRPRYPEELFDFLAAAAPRRTLAWDGATGTGQAAIGLARRFERVVATDASAEQVAQALPNPRVVYGVARAEATPLASGSADLITVAQALHWLDHDRFFAEVRWVLTPGGVVAAWCYRLITIAPEIDQVIAELYHGTLGPYWPPERRHVDDGYRSVAFPFIELEAPQLTIEASMALADLAGYLGTWSAARRYVAERASDPVAEILPALRDRWGGPAVRRVVRWPVAMRVGRL